MVVKDVIAAFGLMVFGIMISVGIAPSVNVAFASESVIPVTLLDSAMLGE